MLTAVGAYLQKVHAFYQIQFPNISYPIRDQAIVKQYMATALLVGPNDCFPAGTRISNLADVVDHYAAKHSEEVIGDSFPFVVRALDDTYRCRPGHD